MKKYWIEEPPWPRKGCIKVPRSLTLLEEGEEYKPIYVIAGTKALRVRMKEEVSK